MRRLTLLVLLGLLVGVSTARAYDGPTPVNYDQTLNTIRVLMTTQGLAAVGGRIRVLTTAFVPVDSDVTSIEVDIRTTTSTGGDVVLARCTYEPVSADRGMTVAVQCNRFVLVPYSASDGTQGMYPYVRRRTRSTPERIHDGKPQMLPVTPVYDDLLEPNGSPAAAQTLGAAGSIALTDLISRNADYYRITVPAGQTITKIRIDFWNGASDLDLFVYNTALQIVGASDSREDFDEVWLALTPGDDYYVHVHNFSDRPAFYDLSIGNGTTVAITDGPTGAPNPTASGGSVMLSVTASDSAGRPVSYWWSAACPGLPSNGTFSSATHPQPQWTAPPNLTGSQVACTIRVTASNSIAQSDTETYLQFVDPLPDVVSFLTSPVGSPNPVSSGGNVTLGGMATDSHAHVLSYVWQASCPGLTSPGAFAPAPVGASPTWTAPPNLTEVEQSCTIEVTASDGIGHSATAVLVQRVEPVPHTVTVTAGPAGAPNPVGSEGRVTLTMTAADSLGHALAYAWQSICSGLPDGGTFEPTASTQNPTWAAPLNLTGSQQSCTLEVTVSDGLGRTATAVHIQHVDSVPHELTVTAGPTGHPNPVNSEGLVALTFAGVDSLGHPLSYAWRSMCPGLPDAGTFSPSASAQTPAWMAPVNATAFAQACTIEVTIADDHGEQLAVTFVEQVEPQNIITLVAPAGGSPNPAPSAGTVSVAVGVEDTLNRPLTYAWTSECPGLPGAGTFNDPSIPSPTWTAPTNTTGVPRTCVLTVTISDDQGNTLSSSFEQVVLSVPQTITLTLGPGGTPNPVVSGGLVTLVVGATDSLGRALSFAWTANCPTLPSNGTFGDRRKASTTWTAPENLTGSQQACTLAVSIKDGVEATHTASFQQMVGTVPEIVSAAGPAVPAIPGGGTLGLEVLGPDLVGQPINYQWTSVCPGLPSSGSFDDATAATPVWTAPVNPTGAPIECMLTVVVTDGQGQTQTASYRVIVEGAPEDCTVSFDPPELEVSATGGTVAVGLVTQPGCAWTATGDVPWMRFAGPASGIGSGALTLAVDVSHAPGLRIGLVVVSGSVFELHQQGHGFRYFLAEGATTNGFFDTRIALLNTDADLPADVTIEFQLKDTTDILGHSLTLGPRQRGTVDVAALATQHARLAALSGQEFSSVVYSTRPLVVDRTMSWDTSGYGGHSETSIEAAGSAWYLAEGATIGNFELFYLIQNPNPEPLVDEIEITYMLPPPAAPIVRTYSMGASTRRNIAVHLEPGLENAEISAIIRTPADKPVIVERAMYLSSGGLFYGAGHESAGIRIPRREWFFAEGATGAFFDLFILIGNPNDVPAHVTATYLFPDGTTCSAPVGNTYQNGQVVVGARSRQNIWVDLETLPGCPHQLDAAAVSTTITADVPVVAERTMWWPGPTSLTWAEAHNTPGATATGVTWGIADGEQGGPRGADTYVLVANTSSYAGLARVSLHFEDGSSVEKIIELVAQGRTTVPIGMGRDTDRAAAGAAERTGFGFGSDAANRRFGVIIESLPAPGQPAPAQIVVERATYWNGPGATFWAAGTNALATRLD
jgi:hypothetical protein